MAIVSRRFSSSLFASIQRAFSAYKGRKNTESDPGDAISEKLDEVHHISDLTNKENDPTLHANKKLCFGNKIATKCNFLMYKVNEWRYIDKTKLINELLQEEGDNFIARPRRFGKTLLMYVIQAIAMNSPILNDLQIGQSERKEEIPVMMFDFSRFQDDPCRITEVIKSEVERHNTVLHLKFYSDNTGSNLMQILSHYYSTGRRSYVLVDEYDNPIWVRDKVQQEKNIFALKTFFQDLKSVPNYIRFMLVTGVTQIGIGELFSGANNIEDRTLEERFATLYGYTEEEIIENFPDFISELARANSTSVKKILQELKEMYNGYNFSINPALTVYNPVSINRCLFSKEIISHWVFTGPDTPILIRDAIKKTDVFDAKKVRFAAGENEMAQPLDINSPSELTLLWQSGYLTIGNYNYDTREYNLKIPNKEIEKAIKFLRAQAYFDLTSRNKLDAVISSLKLLKIKELTELLVELYRNTYRLKDFKSEAEFENSLVLLLHCGNIIPHSQVFAGDGRSDLAFEVGGHAYIVEFKRDSSADKAIEQIIEKKYYLASIFAKYKEIKLLEISYSTTLKTIGYVLIQNFTKMKENQIL